jgi:hypothetical protein
MLLPRVFSLLMQALQSSGAATLEALTRGSTSGECGQLEDRAGTSHRWPAYFPARRSSFKLVKLHWPHLPPFNRREIRGPHWIRIGVPLWANCPSCPAGSAMKKSAPAGVCRGSKSAEPCGRELASARPLHEAEHGGGAALGRIVATECSGTFIANAVRAAKLLRSESVELLR